MWALIPIAVFAMIVFWTWFDTLQKKIRIQARSELYKQLLEKVGSAQELADFLETESGQRFLDGMEPDKDASPTWSTTPITGIAGHRRHGPKEGILGLIIPGCILTTVGMGLFWGSNLSPKLQIPGAIILAVGIGMFFAAALSYFLSKKWGLMNGSDKRPGGFER